MSAEEMFDDEFDEDKDEEEEEELDDEQEDDVYRNYGESSTPEEKDDSSKVEYETYNEEYE